MKSWELKSPKPTVVFCRVETDVLWTNQRGRAPLGQTQGLQQPTVLGMAPLRPLQMATAGAGTAACLTWAVRPAHRVD
eukprot:SAG11_NODE_2811_length_2947_cov_3.850720_3_plen_78_part_00